MTVEGKVTKGGISHQTHINACIIWICFFTPSLCHADIGVPMIFVTLPMMVVALIPIIALESLFSLSLRHLPFKKILKCFIIANLVSTFLGIPVAWFVLFILQILTGGGWAYGLSSPVFKLLAVTWQAPWLIPYRNMHWMIPAALIVLQVPFFFVSWWIEYFVVKIMLPDVDKNVVWKTLRNVNILSYGGLVLFIVILMIFNR